MLPIGVANESLGRAGRAERCKGGARVGTPDSCIGVFTGRAFGDGGIERPSLGARLLLFCLLPGIGGRRSGAGEDMLAID